MAKSETLIMPVNGEVLPIEEAADDAFASGALGRGAAINPDGNKVYAPSAGTVTAMFPSKHAVGIQTDGGADLLIHIGIDTVKLDGKHFTSHVKQGDRVNAGQLLVTFDREKIALEGYNTQTMVVVTNADDYKDISLLAQGSVKAESEFIRLQA